MHHYYYTAIMCDGAVLVLNGIKKSIEGESATKK